MATEIQSIEQLKKEIQAAQTQQTLLRDRLARVIEQKVAAAGVARCGLHMVSGETTVRTMPFPADGASLTLLPPKEIKQRLRGTPNGGEMLFCDSAGSLDWHLDPRARISANQAD